uniref:G-protein coupled receptors family 1 profile domain-containing protein n=1 Tax=Chelonoidis abingdonii TaxID=106734 RepID=A0A8C0GVY2_CHEAB
MEDDNHTSVSEFILVGLSGRPQTQHLLFAAILATYLATLGGNLLIVGLVRANSCLHTPMYFFLSHLSFLEICYTSCTIPQALAHLLTRSKSIPFARCAAQMYLALSLGSTEAILLAAMAYDRLVAVCWPLRYATLMGWGRYWALALSSWAAGFLLSVVNVACTLRLPFCGPNRVNHFFCELPVVLELACTDTRLTEALLKLSCSDTSLNKVVLLAGTVLLGAIPFLCIVVSYVAITRAVLQIRFAQAQWKAFSTCASHLAVVTLFYTTCMFNYNRPTSGHPLYVDTLASVLYNVVTPMLNPLIYSLRNKEVKAALKHAIGKKNSSLKT